MFGPGGLHRLNGVPHYPKPGAEQLGAVHRRGGQRRLELIPHGIQKSKNIQDTLVI